MGVAFFCTDQIANQSVVLKALRADKADSSVPRIRFLQEIVDWVYLGHHPYIVQAYRVELLGSPPSPYLVLERIMGRNEDDEVSVAGFLRRRKGHPLSFRMAVKIAWQVAEAMAFATSKISGLVHRDIKPANILIDVDGDARLTDFGLARSFDNISEHHQRLRKTLEKLDLESIKPAGSPAYIAPEQWQPGNIADTRVDIYALGATLFEMITATRCAKGKDFDEIKQSHRDGDLNAVPEQVPDELADIITICLAFEAQARYQSWGEVIDALSNCYQQLAGETLELPALNPVDKREDLAQSYVTIAKCYLNLGLLNEATSYISEVQASVMESGDVESIAEYCKTSALIFAAKNQFSQAIEVVNVGLGIVREAGVDSLVAELSSILADQLMRDRQETQGLNMHQMALTLARSSGDPQLEIMALGNIANAYAQKGELNKAIKTYKQQLELPAMASDPVSRAVATTNLGFAYLENGDSVNAISSFEIAQRTAMDCAYISGQSHAMRGLCDAYLEINDVGKAKSALINFKEWSLKWRDEASGVWATQALSRLG